MAASKSGMDKKTAAGFALIHSAVTSQAPVTIPDRSDSLMLKDQPGQTLAFALTGTSISGYWALSNGLTLAALQDGAGTFQVARPKSESWGNSIDCGTNGNSCSTSGFTVPAQFTIPSRYSPGAMLADMLTGDITYPASSGQEGTFEDANDTVDTQVAIQVTAARSAGPQHETYGLGWPVWLAIFGGHLVLLTAVARSKAVQGT